MRAIVESMMIAAATLGALSSKMIFDMMATVTNDSHQLPGLDVEFPDLQNLCINSIPPTRKAPSDTDCGGKSREHWRATNDWSGADGETKACLELTGDRQLEQHSLLRARLRWPLRTIFLLLSTAWYLHRWSLSCWLSTRTLFHRHIFAA